MKDILPPDEGGHKPPNIRAKLSQQKQSRTSAKKQALVERLASASEEVAASITEIA